MLHDPDYHVRYQAADELSAVHDAWAIHALIELLGDVDPRDEESRVARHAVGSLIRIGPVTVPYLLQTLQAVPQPADRTGQLRRYWCADTLGVIGGQAVVEPLLEALATDRTGGVAEALERLGDDRAIGPLQTRQAELTQADGYVYLAVGQALDGLLRKQRRAKRRKAA